MKSAAIRSIVAVVVAFAASTVTAQQAARSVLVAPLPSEPTMAPSTLPGATYASAATQHAGGPAAGVPACAACDSVHGVHGCWGAACAPCIQAVDCADGCGAELLWQHARPTDFQPLGAGEYIGPARVPPYPEYRLRSGDTIEFIYVTTRRQRSGSYRLMPGDSIMIESFNDEEDDLTRGSLENGLEIQADGTVAVRLLGQVQAAGLTIDQLRAQLNDLYSKYYLDPQIDVTPVRTNRLLEDVRDAVGGQSGLSRPAVSRTVVPDGTVRLPVIGEVAVQGLTLEELKREINLRYAEVVHGLEVEPALEQQAPHFIYVLGDVTLPGRYQLEAPTTALGGLALAGSPIVGANLRQVVIFRRADDWRLVSTMLDLRGAIRARRPTPSDELWLRDGDVVIVPSSEIRIFNNFVRQVFTEGVYGIVPFGGISFSFGDTNN